MEPPPLSVPRGLPHRHNLAPDTTYSRTHGPIALRTYVSRHSNLQVGRWGRELAPQVELSGFDAANP